MLEDCLIESRSTARTRKPTTLAISVFIHGAIAAALILIPLFQTHLLPQVAAFMPLRPPAALGRSIDLVPVFRSAGPARSTTAPVTNPLTVPPVAPTKIFIVDDLPPDGLVGPTGPGASAGGGDPNGSLFSRELFTESRVVPPRPPAPPSLPPPPPPNPEPVPPPPLRVGSLEPSKLLHMVQPTYPKLASITQTEGKVMLEAVIMSDGSVDPKRLKVISGHVLLVPAAVEAVQQWRYQPTVLNGETIEIIATITVNFTLKR